MSTKNKDLENKKSSHSLEKTASDNKDSRRNILKKLAVGGLAAGAAMPTKWSKPVVDAVVLPAHAQTSDATVRGGGGGTSVPPGPTPGNTIGEDVLDFFVSEASAGGGPTDFCIEITVTQNNSVITSVTCTKICFNAGCFADQDKYYNQTITSVALTGEGSTWSGSIPTRNGIPEPMPLTITNLDVNATTLCTAQLGGVSGEVINGGTCNCPCPAKPRP